MTAKELKAALRRRHPATMGMGERTVPGPWVCIDELLGCDLVAFSAHQRATITGVSRSARYPRVGYEVKVSRSDYSREIAAPSKRAKAVGYCHHFYFAVPVGLLTAEEIAREHGNLCVPSDVGLIVVSAREVKGAIDTSDRGVLRLFVGWALPLWHWGFNRSHRRCSVASSIR